MRHYLFLILIFSLFSCKKDEAKFPIEYKVINKNDYRKVIIGIETFTYFPNEKVTLWKGKSFQILIPDTVSIILNELNDYLGYNGCKKSFNVRIETYETMPGDSTKYQFLRYYRIDPAKDQYSVINNASEAISTFIWPDDTSKWIKVEDVRNTWKNNN